VYKFILQQSKGLKLWGLLSALLTVAGVGLSYLFPMASRYIIDVAIPQKLKEKLLLICIGLVLLYLVNTVLSVASSQVTRFFRERMIQRIRHALFSNILYAKFDQTQQMDMNDLSSRLIRDVHQIESIMLDTWILMFKEFLVGIVGIVLLLRLSPVLLWIVIPALPFVFLITHWKSNRISPIVKDIQEESGKLTGHILTPLYNLMFIKVYNLEKVMYKKLTQSTEKLIKKNLKFNKERTISSQFNSFIYSVVGVLLFLLSGLLIINNEMTLGTLVAAGYIINLILGSVQTLAGFQIDIKSAKASFRRIDDIIKLKTEKQFGTVKYIQSFDISIKNLRFAYPERPPIFDGLNIKIPDGQKAAIVGASGSGKSTLVKLLLKLYEPLGGSISIGGQNIINLNHEFIRGKIAYIPQRTYLFDATIRENIAFGHLSATEEEIMQAVRTAQLKSFVEKLPDGLDTKVLNTTINLSGGEAQRISIARAFLKNAPIIILDESTSQLDAENEKEIREVLKKLCTDKTVIIIAHRLSTVVECNQIYVMEKGRLLDRGTHDMLYERCPYYRNICDIQFISKDLCLT